MSRAGKWLIALCANSLASAHDVWAADVDVDRINASRINNTQIVRTPKIVSTIDALSRRALSSGKFSSPDPTVLAALRRRDPPTGSWGGHGCVGLDEMRGLVDDHLATVAPNFLRSYRTFFEAFVNGGLLSRTAQHELDASFVPVPDFDYAPFVTVKIGFGLGKLKLTGYPGIPDSQIINHDGSLPGVSCSNVVVREHDSERTLAAGALCQNAHGSGHPTVGDLWLEFIVRIVEAGASP